MKKKENVFNFGQKFKIILVTKDDGVFFFIIIISPVFLQTGFDIPKTVWFLCGIY